jgi:hypothetical protein
MEVKSEVAKKREVDPGLLSDRQEEKVFYSL